MIRGFLVFLIVSSLLLVSLFYFNDVFAACDPGSAPARADFLVTAPTLLGKFYSAYQSTGVCIFSPDISFDTNSIPNYDKLKTDYYTNSKPGTSKPPDISGPSLTIQNYYLYHSSGDLSLSSVTGSGIGLVFVDGNLEITGNILYGKGNAQSGLVFIVKGNVYINASVTEVNAVIVSEGKIYTAASLNGSCDTNFPHQALTVNGSLISINPTSPIVFCRDKLDNTTPAEIVNHQAKYLILLKDIFSETQQKWEEIVELPDLNVLPFYPTPIITLKANGSAAPITINNGASVTLSWSVINNPTSCNASGSWSGSKPIPDGNEPTGSLSGPNTYTYTLTCSNLGGQNSASVTVTVNPPTPTVTLSANGSTSTFTIGNNETAQLSWVTTNSPTSCTASGSWSGAKSTTGGSETTAALAGPNTYTYTLSCSNAAGSATSSVTVNVNAPPLTVTTLAATNVTDTGATLNSSVNLNGFATTGWYKWGTTNAGSCASWPNITSSVSLGSGTSAVPNPIAISGLSPSTTYWFCAAAQNIGGTTYGNKLSFTTLPPPYAYPTPAYAYPTPYSYPTPVVCPTWYQDQDNDTFGNPAVSQISCTQPSGYVTNNNDCYDLNATARPGKTQIFFNHRGDGSWDYDCSGAVNGLSFSSSSTTFQNCPCTPNPNISSCTNTQTCIPGFNYGCGTTTSGGDCTAFCPGTIYAWCL